MNGHSIAIWMVNAVIAITLMEGVLLVLWHTLRGRGPAPADIVCNLGAGLCLLGALRSELGGAGELACGAWLAAAGLSHALDSWRRWPVGSGTARHRNPTVSSAYIFQPGTKRHP